MRQKKTLGIDEAGRGPVLGQMVLAAVLLDSKGASALTRAGLTDSKSYGSGKKGKAIRTQLAAEVRKHALYIGVQAVPVPIVDQRVRLGQLNALERDVARVLIANSPIADRIVADGERLFAPMKEEFSHLEAYNKGESKHASVAAASVIAKTRRDELFALMQKRYLHEFGQVEGGGYVNPKTQAFLRAYAKKYGELPPEARRSWPFKYLEDIIHVESQQLSLF